jgi:hypothetical protein
MTYKASDLAAFVGSMYRGNPFFIVPYAYFADFGTIAASSQGTATIQINANADFTLTRLYMLDPLSTAFELLIEDSGTNERYSDAPVSRRAYGVQSIGMSGGGYLFPFPRFVQGNTVLTLTINNLSTGEIVPQVMLEGVSSKVYSAQRA